MFRLYSEGNALALLQAPCMSPLSCRYCSRMPRCWLATKGCRFGLEGVSLALCHNLRDFELTFSPLSWIYLFIVSVYCWTYVRCIVFEGQKFSIKVCLIEFDTQPLKSGHHLQLHVSEALGWLYQRTVPRQG